LTGCKTSGGQRSLLIFSALCGGASQGIGEYQINQLQVNQFRQQQEIYNLQHK